jgi:hypothetical protein
MGRCSVSCLTGRRPQKPGRIGTKALVPRVSAAGIEDAGLRHL